MKLDSLHALFVEELKDIYNAEQQVLKALPKMQKAASAAPLREAFEEHHRVTQRQVERLERVFEKIGQPAKGKKCVGMEGLIEEGNEFIKGDSMDPSVRDAALIAAAQRVEHYEIAVYGTLRTYADMLNHKDVSKLLQETLHEEEASDRKLTELAVSWINREAQ